MSFQNQPPSTPLPSQPEVQPAQGKPRFARVRAWLRSRTGRVVIPIVALVLGMVSGIFTILLLGESGGRPIIIVPATSKGEIIVEADKAFLTQLVTMNLSSSGMPGQIEIVNVNLVQGDQMTVSGDDRFSVLGIGVTRHFTFVVQPYVSSCVLQVHIVHADFSNIPVTRFTPGFERHINQQLQKKPQGLPNGFQYCTTGVRTEPAGMFVTYAATVSPV
jgi:hypothetical protein